MILKKPTLNDLYEVAKWRNLVPESLRTIGETTEEQQENFYKNVICDKYSMSKYYSVYDNDNFIGFTGLTDINFVNANAEISLIVNMDYSKRGYGTLIVDKILYKAFNEFRLENVYGECYVCNKSIEFWMKISIKYNAHKVFLPGRKYWNAGLHPSLYFTINKEDYNKCQQ